MGGWGEGGGGRVYFKFCLLHRLDPNIYCSPKTYMVYQPYPKNIQIISHIPKKKKKKIYIYISVDISIPQKIFPLLSFYKSESIIYFSYIMIVLVI